MSNYLSVSSILAVYRGLPSKRNLAAPAVTAWLKQIQSQDSDLNSQALHS